MEFSKEELEIIYSLLEDYGYSDSSKVILDKIETKYKYCHMCGKLFLHEDWQAHYDQEFRD